MTPRRRQGSGRAAMDRIDRQLTESLSQLSRVTASQAAIAESARDDIPRTIAVLARLDDELLAAVLVAARQLQTLGQAVQDRRAAEGNSP